METVSFLAWLGGLWAPKAEVAHRTQVIQMARVKLDRKRREKIDAAGKGQVLITFKHYLQSNDAALPSAA